MGLKGNLDGIKLTDIFQMLAMSQREQTLTVWRGRDKRVFYFTPGSINVILSPDVETALLGQILVGMGYLSQTQMDEALKRQQNDPRRIGEILVDMGLCTPEQIEECLKIQLESTIYDLLLWDFGTFEVTEGPPQVAHTDGQRVLCVTFDPSGLLMEAARRMDEWDTIRQTIPSLDLVFVRTAENSDDLPPAEGSLLAEKILAYVDGRRRVRDIVDACHLPAFDVSFALAQLLNQGRIRNATSDELLEMIQEHLREKDNDRALSFCEQLAATAESNEDILVKVGRIYERLGYNERAAQALATAGKLYLDTARFNEAIEALDKASQLNRDDLEIKEHLLSALSESGRVDRAISVARVLTQAFHRRGEYARARAMCQFILTHRSQDVEARFSLTEIHLATGNLQAAAAESNILAHILPYGQDQRLKTLRSRIERGGLPSAHTHNARVDLHPEARTQSRAHAPLLITFVALLLILVTGGGLWLWMERAAAQARGEIDRHAQELLIEKRYTDAIAQYQSVVEKYPLTSTARELKRLIVSLKLKQQNERSTGAASATLGTRLSLSTTDNPQYP